MNKDELVTTVAQRTQMPKKTAEQLVTAAFETISEALAKDEKVTLVGFGTFAIRERAARLGKNPRTGETIQIKARKSPNFTAGKALKDRLGQPG
jgi:DNA-binding protein HU-beta